MSAHRPCETPSGSTFIYVVSAFIFGGSGFLVACVLTAFGRDFWPMALRFTMVGAIIGVGLMALIFGVLTGLERPDDEL